MHVYFSVAYLGFTAFLFHKHLSLTSLKGHPLLNKCFTDLRNNLQNQRLVINPQLYQGKFGRVFEFDIEFFSSEYSGVASGRSYFLDVNKCFGSSRGTSFDVQILVANTYV